MTPLFIVSYIYLAVNYNLHDSVIICKYWYKIVIEGNRKKMKKRQMIQEGFEKGDQFCFLKHIFLTSFNILGYFSSFFWFDSLFSFLYIFASNNSLLFIFVVHFSLFVLPFVQLISIMCTFYNYR